MCVCKSNVLSLMIGKVYMSKSNVWKKKPRRGVYDVEEFLELFCQCCPAWSVDKSLKTVYVVVLGC